MTLAFTTDGMTIDTYDEIVARLDAGYRAIYGADINLEPNSPDGQRVGLESKEILDTHTFILKHYSLLDPDLSNGDLLDIVIKLNGITRNPATRSQVDVTINVAYDLTLPNPYRVEDSLKQIWETTLTPSLLTGNNTVTLFAENLGAVEAEPATVTVPETIVLGVNSVTNPTAATVGADEETDPQLRARRRKSLQSAASSTVGGMYTAVSKVQNVIDAVVYENKGTLYDAVRDINANTIWLVVEGGAVSDIAEAMVKSLTGGTGLKGSTSSVYTETLTRPGGSTYTVDHPVFFDRPTDVPLYVSFTVRATSGTVDVAGIKAKIAAREFLIAEALDAGELYADAYSIDTNYVVTLMQISDDDITYTDGELSPGYAGKFSLDVLDITVTEI